MAKSDYANIVARRLQATKMQKNASTNTKKSKISHLTQNLYHFTFPDVNTYIVTELSNLRISFNGKALPYLLTIFN